MFALKQYFQWWPLRCNWPLCAILRALETCGPALIKDCFYGGSENLLIRKPLSPPFPFVGGLLDVKALKGNFKVDLVVGNAAVFLVRLPGGILAYLQYQYKTICFVIRIKELVRCSNHSGEGGRGGGVTLNLVMWKCLENFSGAQWNS